MFGTILQRTIFWELMRVFLLALVTLTSLFLLAGLVAEATQRGLAPSQVLAVIPLLIPNTLPYTIPATTLFATCVIYGRLSHDNEITALKSAGVHLGHVVAPSVFLGLLSTAGTAALYYDFIPKTHQMLRMQVLSDVEELLYGVLKRQGSIKHKDLPFAMWVRQVQGRRLYDVIFKDPAKEKGGYRGVLRAREATLHYDAATNSLRVDMSYCSAYGDAVQSSMQSPTYTYPLPTTKFMGNDYVRRPSDFGYLELFERQVTIVDEVAQTYEDTLTPPQMDRNVSADEAVKRARFRVDSHNQKKREAYSVDVEIHIRPALAVGCLVFVLLGAPVGIWFSRADYLSTFVSCFLPAVLSYYPILLCGTNLAKEGRVPAAVGLWAANAVVGSAALIMNWRLLRR